MSKDYFSIEMLFQKTSTLEATIIKSTKFSYHEQDNLVTLIFDSQRYHIGDIFEKLLDATIRL